MSAVAIKANRGVSNYRNLLTFSLEPNDETDKNQCNDKILQASDKVRKFQIKFKFNFSLITLIYDTC